LENILNQCDVKTKLNVACCNRNLQHITEPLLWRTVGVDSDYLTQAENDCSRIKYTTSLKISTRYTHVPKFAHFTVDQSANYGFNLCKVLNDVERSKLTTLCINRTFSDDCFRRVLEALPYVEDLTLKCVILDVASIWGVLTISSKLKRLSLYNCNVTNAFIKLILECNPLQVLIVSKCRQVTNKGLLHIGTLGTHLTKLEFHTVHTVNNIFDIKCLGVLNKLNYLSLDIASNVPDVSLIHLCECMEGLRTLKICGFDFSNYAFSKIQLLWCLQYLVIRNCSNITSHVLRHLKPLASLQHLEFDADICEDDTEDDAICDEVAVLNRMPKLEKITIKGCEKVVDFDIICSLCEGRKWILKADREEEVYVLYKV